MLSIFMLAVAVSCGIALINWRIGIAAAVLMSLLQDPVRKAIPGTPAYLLLVAIPIWLCVLVSAARYKHLNAGQFLKTFPRLGWWTRIFALFLVIPAAISLTYSYNSWIITLLGAFMYATMFLLVLVGWRFPEGDLKPAHFLAFYGIVASFMLLGGPMEVAGIAPDSPLLGTEALGHVWVTHRVGAPVYMRAGFFRSPDVMGWHASLTCMIAIVLAFRAKGWARWLWIAVAVLAVMNIWLCGRRKMYSMILVFLGCYALFLVRFSQFKKMLAAASITLIVAGVGWYLISAHFYDAAVERFYLTAFTEAETSIQRHAFASVFSTVRQAGFWGYGLGMSQQGVHNIPNVEMPRVWQESGPSKLFAELGVPGVILFLIWGGVFFLTAFHTVRRSRGREALFLNAGILSILMANVASAMVSAQIFGDPLVVFLLVLLIGLLLSDVRNGAGVKSGPQPIAALVEPAPAMLQGEHHANGRQP